MVRSEFLFDRDFVARVVWSGKDGEEPFKRDSQGGKLLYEIKGWTMQSATHTFELIDKIQRLLKRHVYFSDPDTALLIAVWVLGSYLYKEFTYYGYLWITSATKGSGKTLLLDILSHLSNNCPGRLSNISEATLFREADSGKTLILDESENLQTADRQRWGALMSVFNDGFKKGGMVPRQEADPENKGKFKTAYFSTYSPKVFAGLNDVLDTIESRSFKIVMIKKTSSEHVERFSLRLQQTELDSLRNQIKTWSLVKRLIIGDNYAVMGSNYRDFKGLDDRLVDILEPLAVIAAFADVEHDEAFSPPSNYYERLLAVVRRMRQQQEGSTRNMTIQIILEVASKAVAISDPAFVPTETFLDVLKVSGEFSILNGKALASLMEKLSLSPKSTGDKRGYYVTRAWVDETKRRYLSELTPEASDVSHASA